MTIIILIILAAFWTLHCCHQEAFCGGLVVSTLLHRHQ